MRHLLRQNNADMLRDLERLGEALHQARAGLLPELENFYTWLVAECGRLQQAVVQNLHDLDLSQSTILPDVLSNTQVINRRLNLFNRYFLSPVLRADASDRLCLRLLNWLHAQHSSTSHLPVALNDGDFASWPYPDFPTIYFMPPSAQRRLLYLPLFFHELGHLLYACHKPEMDDLILALQKNLARYLAAGTQRNDLHAQKEQENRNVIIQTWFDWAQEIFCDAVGFVIGGPAFAHAFSFYFRVRGREQYHIKREELLGSTHPVTWLRIGLIADRARRMGFADLAVELESSWQTIADGLEVREDYYGLYETALLPVIQQTIDDMLTEASPRPFEESEVGGAAGGPLTNSPILLVNQAWEHFLNDAESYSAWEITTTNLWLGASRHPLQSDGQEGKC